MCGKPLTAPVARKLGRCEDCPSSYDEELFERLREWRAEQAREQRPGVRRLHRRHPDRARRGRAHHATRALLAVSGVGRTKLERYGADVLAICAGEPPPSRRTADGFGTTSRQQSKNGLHLTATASSLARSVSRPHAPATRAEQEVTTVEITKT